MKDNASDRGEAPAATDEMTEGEVLEILCRVFEDGADRAMEEWREFYNPAAWFGKARALGAFINLRYLDKDKERQAHHEAYTDFRRQLAITRSDLEAAHTRIAQLEAQLGAPAAAPTTPLRDAFCAGAAFNAVTSSLSGDGHIRAEAERRYPAVDPAEPVIGRLLHWSCFACGQRVHGQGDRCTKCFALRARVGARPVCGGCGSDLLMRMDEYNNYEFNDLPTDHPLRCQTTFGPDWHVMNCHKPKGHAGPHSTHNDCGEQSPRDGSICGKLPGHAGLHGWEIRHAEEDSKALTTGSPSLSERAAETPTPISEPVEPDDGMKPFTDDDAAALGQFLAGEGPMVVVKRSELADLRKDKERLDWLEKVRPNLNYQMEFNDAGELVDIIDVRLDDHETGDTLAIAKSLRSAIDASASPSPENK